MILPTDDEGAGLPRGVRFDPGRMFVTPAALEALKSQDITDGLRRHLTGDWGDLCPEDKAENELSLKEGFRLFSVYHGANGVKFYIITEADRNVTTILLPADY